MKTGWTWPGSKQDTNRCRLCGEDEEVTSNTSGYTAGTGVCVEAIADGEKLPGAFLGPGLV